MKKYKRIIVLLNLVALIIFFNYSIEKKEILLKEGKLVLLKLAPVDPRSLMQGDYMSLQYKISDGIEFDSISKRGYVVVQLQPNGIADKVRLQNEKKPLNNNEYLIKYTSGKLRLNVGAESFFFQEGQAEKFVNATYGGIRIDKEGNSLLIGLYDKQLKKIE